MRFRTLRGYSTEGRANVRSALALPAIAMPDAARAKALYMGGALAMNQGDHAEAAKMLTECLAIWRSLGDAREIAATLSELSTLRMQMNEFDRARECQGEALGIFREQGDRIGEGISLLNLGGIAARQGDRESAVALCEQSLAIARSIRHQELESECEESIGDLALRPGDLREAEARFARALKICRDAEDKRGEAIAVWSLGRVDAANGHHDAARRKFADALPAFQSFGMNAEALDCVDDCAALLCAVDRPDDAVRLHAAAATIRGALALQSSGPGGARESDLAAARRALGEAAFAAAWSEGSAWTLEATVERARTLSTAVAVTA